MRPEDISEGASKVGTTLRYPTPPVERVLTALAELGLTPDSTPSGGDVSFLSWLAATTDGRADPLEDRAVITLTTCP